MKRYILTLTIALVALTAKAISYDEARREAWFLTDKMAYELNLTQEQFNYAYQINLDYFLNLNSFSDIDSYYWHYRDADLRYILLDNQYALYCAIDYFYRPIRWIRSTWYYPVFDHYRSGYYYFSRPNVYINYRGEMWAGRTRGGVSPYHNVRIRRDNGMRDRFFGNSYNVGFRGSYAGRSNTYNNGYNKGSERSRYNSHNTPYGNNSNSNNRYQNNNNRGPQGGSRSFGGRSNNSNNWGQNNSTIGSTRGAGSSSQTGRFDAAGRNNGNTTSSGTATRGNNQQHRTNRTMGR